MIKKITIMLMAAVLLLGMAVCAHAMESPDLTREGTLTLVMEWAGEKLNSGSLTIFRVGEIAPDGDRWEFRLIPELQGSGISLEDLNDARLAKQLEQQVKDNELPGTVVPIRDGEAVFAELTAGLFLVIQEEACEGFSAISPFLISLPRWEEDRYVYDLTAKPKVALEPLPTEPPETEPTEPEPSKPVVPGEPELPQTGQLNWPVPVMAVAGLALFAMGWHLSFGKKSGHES